MGSRRDRLTAETAAIRSILANADMLRLLLAWLAANATTYSFLVVSLVVAYDAGGALAVGLMGVVRYVPPTFIAPLAGIPTARWPTHRVLLGVIGARLGVLVATILVLAAGGPIWLVFALVALEASCSALTRPLHMSLLPWLARTPGELVASNISSSAAEALGTLIGPAIAGILLATTDPVGATSATAVMIAVAVVAVLAVRVPSIPSRRSAAPVRQGITAGLRAFTGIPVVRIVLTHAALQTGVRGMLTVLIVVVAIDRLGLGEPGVGTLNAAIGAGGFAGAVVSLSLTSRSRFASTYSISLALWGLPIAVLGIVADPVVAIGMLAIVGMSNAIFDVTAFTLLQRASPNDQRVAVMGTLDSLAAGSTALGGLLASALMGAFGIQVALLVTGAILPVAAAVGLLPLRAAEGRLDVHETEAQVLRADPLLGLLSLSIVEELVGAMRRVAFQPGDSLIREGERGNQYLMVTDGTVSVSRGGQVLRQLGPGSGVGEISLLRNVPRTATVTAVGQVEAYALDCDVFLGAVTGHSPARLAADAIVDDRLARTPGEPGSSAS